jgi:hypothetical protein
MDIDKREMNNIRKENSSENHLPYNKTELLPGLLPFVPNMPVLITDNIACELGLSNGTQ